MVKDKWRKQYHEEEMAMLNNAAGEARTEILPPGTHSSRENESEGVYTGHGLGGFGFDNSGAKAIE